MARPLALILLQPDMGSVLSQLGAIQADLEPVR